MTHAFTSAHIDEQIDDPIPPHVDWNAHSLSAAPVQSPAPPPAGSSPPPTPPAEISRKPPLLLCLRYPTEDTTPISAELSSVPSRERACP
jgi:hypothetical protein